MNDPRVNYFDVYIWEAHPGQPLPAPENFEERIENYEYYVDKYDVEDLDCLIDEIDDSWSEGFWGSTETTGYVIDKDRVLQFGRDLKFQWSGQYKNIGNMLDELLQDIPMPDTIPPEVEVTAPGAGVQFQPDEDVDIEWTATDNVNAVASVEILFSKDNGTYWESIVELTTNTGTYSWTVPSDLSDECLIKVEATDGDGNVGSDESDAFSIVATGIIHTSTASSKWITFKNTRDANMVFIPFTGNFDVTVTNIHGKQIASFTTYDNGSYWYKIPKLSSGIHVLSIRTPNKTIIKKFRSIR